MSSAEVKSVAASLTAKTWGFYFCNLTFAFGIQMTWKERERAFFIGAPLAVIPALGFLPLTMFLLVAPVVANGQQLALIVFPLLAVAGCIGLWQLAIGAVERPFGALNALSVGTLVVVVIIAAYTGLFMAFIAVKL